jgi:hypothetical protein
MDAADQQTIVEASQAYAEKQVKVGQGIAQLSSDPLIYEPLTPDERDKAKVNLSKVFTELDSARVNASKLKDEMSISVKAIAEQMPRDIDPSPMLREAEDPSYDANDIMIEQISKLSPEDGVKALSVYSKFRDIKGNLITTQQSIGSLQSQSATLMTRLQKGQPINISKLKNGIRMMSENNAFMGTAKDRDAFWGAVSDSVNAGDDPEKVMLTTAIYSIFNRMKESGEYKDMPTVLDNTFVQYQDAINNGTLDSGSLPYGREIVENVRAQKERFEIYNKQKDFENALNGIGAWRESLSPKSPLVVVKAPNDKGEMVDMSIDFSAKGINKAATQIENLERSVKAKYSKYGPEMLAQYMEPVVELSNKLENKKIEQRLRETYIAPAQTAALNRGVFKIGELPSANQKSSGSVSDEDIYKSVGL